MRLSKPHCLAMALLGGAAAPAYGQSGGGGLEGAVAIGVRSVELAGTESKYREDVNLDDGLRLFDLSLDYRPEGVNAPIDDFSLRASSLGGDPYESVQLALRKFGAYRLQLDRRRSDYFYDDVILPAALASVNGSTGGDFHTYDFERVRDTAALDLDLSPATRVSLGLERQTRKGESTTTLDIARDEFELDKPLDESLERLRIGVEHEWDRVSLIFEESFGKFENTSELFLPGASPGQNVTGNPAELQYFFLDQYYDYDNRSHLLRVIAEPTERIDLAAVWRSEDLELGLQSSEESLGTDFTGAPLASDLSGSTDVGRDLDLAGLDFGYSIGERARLVAGTRSSQLRQNGYGAFGPDSNGSRWRIDTDSFELGGELAFGRGVVLTLGRSVEQRDVRYSIIQNSPAGGAAKATDRAGFFARMDYRAGRLSLQASVDDNSIDDPFALAAPTDTRRVRLGARYRWASGISIQGSVRRTDVGNDTSGWLADTDQTDIRLGYRRERLELSAGVSRTELAREVDQLVTGGTLQILYPVAFAADMRQRDVWVSWSATTRIALGGSFASYDSRGSFPLERDDHRLWLDFALTPDYSLLASYRDVDYVEDAFDAYDADIVELALQVRW